MGSTPRNLTPADQGCLSPPVGSTGFGSSVLERDFLPKFPASREFFKKISKQIAPESRYTTPQVPAPRPIFPISLRRPRGKTLVKNRELSTPSRESGIHRALSSPPPGPART